MLIYFTFVRTWCAPVIGLLFLFQRCNMLLENDSPTLHWDINSALATVRCRDAHCVEFLHYPNLSDGGNDDGTGLVAHDPISHACAQQLGNRQMPKFIR